MDGLSYNVTSLFAKSTKGELLFVDISYVGRLDVEFLYCVVNELEKGENNLMSDVQPSDWLV
jgi:hypothetical protein